MNNIRDIKEESVRQLATTLKASGLAASETEAIRMAMSMSHTNSKVTQNFEDRKEKNTMGLSHLNKETKDQKDQRLASEAKQNEYKMQQDQSVDIPKTAEQIVEEQRLVANEAQTSSPTQTPEEDIDLSNITLEEASSGQIHTEPQAEETTTEVVEEMKEDITIEFKDDEEFIVQDVVKSAQEEEVQEPAAEPQEQPTQQQAPNTPIRKPKKDISEMEESRVDLGSVFNFNKG